MKICIIYFSHSITIYEGEFHKVMAAETTRRLAITAIALKRFALKHAEYPEQLAELVHGLFAVGLARSPGWSASALPATDGWCFPPLFPSAIMASMMAVSPSVFPAAKFSLLNWQNADARDWVWPQVASPAEVEAFSASIPPK